MYALVAFKRTLERVDMPTRHQIMFEIRSFGCFNGFNQANAFVAGTTGEGSDLIVEVQEDGTPLGGNNPTHAFSKSNSVEERASRQGCAVGQWQCIGIGFLSYAIGGVINKTRGEIAPQQIPGQNKASGQIGAYLAREGFQDGYYDAWKGEYGRTIRELTPNERFLSNFGKNFQKRTMTFSLEMQRSSRMALAWSSVLDFNHSTIQFVGSERSSGQAISYLQAWRNTAEINIGGWASRKPLFAFLTTALSTTLRANQSIIAILSYFCNGGSDSDNISFASRAYAAYCTRVGFWKTANLFRNQESMLVEGRYNKGGQADAISANLRREIASRNAQGRFPTNCGRKLEGILGGLTALNAVIRLCEPSIINQNRRSPQMLVDAFGTALRNFYLSDPSVLIAEFVSEAEDLPDLSFVPPPPATVPQTRADGAGLSFLQWATQTAEETLAQP